jgi:hypothetical protein
MARGLRLYCLFAGHQYWLGRGTDRLFLKCSVCGRETAGIHVGADEPAARSPWWRRRRRQPQARVVPAREA